MNGTWIVDRDFRIGDVDDRIFGGFIEHIGRAVYTGIYEPGHPTADADGFRNDVADLVRDLHMPVTRYPGGNFVSGYDWHDGVGPVEDRPVRADYAWQAIEPNRVGVGEFVKWCAKVGTAPMMAVNLGTGTIDSARELVEYCNFPGGTAASDRRRRNGDETPYGIRLWCLGNEMDGPWQIGHRTAAEYGRLADECAKLMKLVDPKIELAVCGSSTWSMKTFGEWDRIVLENCFDSVEYISLHAYFRWPREKPTPVDFLASPEVLDRQIRQVAATCDHVAACRKSAKKIMLSLDEWNTWNQTDPRDETKWQTARPLLEDIYKTVDAIVVGGLLTTMLNHADRLKIGCLAQTVNVIAPIMTRPGGGAWKQTTYAPFQLTSLYGRGTVLESRIESPAYSSPGVDDPVRYLLGATVWNPDAGEVRLFALNRSLDEALDLNADLRGFAPERVVSALTIHHDDLRAVNTETVEAVRPVELPEGTAKIKPDGSGVSVRLPPASWNLIRIAVK